MYDAKNGLGFDPIRTIDAPRRKVTRIESNSLPLMDFVWKLSMTMASIVFIYTLLTL